MEEQRSKERLISPAGWGRVTPAQRRWDDCSQGTIRTKDLKPEHMTHLATAQNRREHHTCHSYPEVQRGPSL